MWDGEDIVRVVMKIMIDGGNLDVVLYILRII